jgi:hypothetical protein
MQTLIHLTSDDAGDFEHAMRCALLLARHDDLPHENVTLLVHRRGARIVLPDSPHADAVADLLDAGVTVTVGATCLDALDRPHEALPGVRLVPSGVSEVVRRQSAGYHYVKVP